MQDVVQDVVQGVVQGAEVQGAEVQATWAEVAADRRRWELQEATRRLRFRDKFAQMEASEDLWGALQDSMDGRANFTMVQVCEGVYRFDYEQPTTGSGVLQ